MAKYFLDARTIEQTTQERAKTILHGPILAIHRAGDGIKELAEQRGGLAALMAELGDEAAPLAQLYTELTALANTWSDVPAPVLE